MSAGIYAQNQSVSLATLEGLGHADDASERQHAHAKPESSQERSTAHSMDTGSDSEELCAICLESLPPQSEEHAEKQCTTRCGHRFHEACFLEAMRTDKYRRCALCRAGIDMQLIPETTQLMDTQACFGDVSNMTAYWQAQQVAASERNEALRIFTEWGPPTAFAGRPVQQRCGSGCAVQ